ncbi:MAG: ADOP family duplicated permease [Longimicrobiales bacterium]|nr:ADOP family duplicated permease [Longimicrobiales bacterium]
MRPPWRGEDLEAEIRHHIRESADLLITQGWDPEDAWHEAERRFGDPGAVREELDAIGRHRHLADRVTGVLARLLVDFRVALRGLRLRPGFAAAVVATLALGVGTATAVFTVVDAVLLRPLPYADAERWMEVWGGTAERSSPVQTPERFDGWRDAGSAVADAWVGITRQTLVRTDGTVPEPLSMVAITPGAVSLLEVPLLFGRDFAEEDAEPGAESVAILTRRYWERLGADRGVLGTTLHLETGPATVVGVLREDVKIPDHGPVADLWVPLRRDFTAAGREVPGIYRVWARRPPGLSLEAAQDRANVVAASLEEARPGDTGWSLVLHPLGEHRINPGPERGVRILAGTAALILLIAVVNGVNLILVRTTARRRELAVRVSLGCGRARLARQLLVEGLVVGGMGAMGALALAALAVPGLRPMMPGSITFFSPYPVTLEGRAVGFCVLAALAAGALLGLVPALRDPSLTALTGSRTGDDPPGQRKLRRGLVAAQVALSLTLLTVAGLFGRSMATLLAVDPGFDVERVALAQFTPPSSRYPSAPERAEVLRGIEERLRTVPGVEAVGTSSGTGFSFGSAIETEGDPAPEEQPYLIPYTSAGAGYLEAMGFEVEEGRGFIESDVGREVAVIDRDLATFLWHGGSAVGRRFRIGDDEWIEVVGVVRELRLMGRDERDGPYQFLRSPRAEGPGSFMELAVRTRGSPSAVLPEIRMAIAAIDPWISVHSLRTAADALAEEEGEPRFLLTLMAALAAVALALASVGLYGVLSYSVGQREREMGIRMALGAERGRIRRMVLLDGLGVTILGIALGVGGAWLASDLVTSLLYEISPRDPLALGGSAILFLAVAALASWIPARRATGVDPAEVLRSE